MDEFVPHQTSDTVGDRLDSLLAAVAELDEVGALRAIAVSRRCFDVCEAEILAARIDPDTGDDREAGRLLAAADGGGSTRRDRRDRLGRAAVVGSVGRVRDAWEAGEIGEAHLDALRGAERARPGSLDDPELVEQVVSASAERASQVKKDWLNNKTSADEVEAKYRRQRDQRSVRRFTTAAGLAGLEVVGDDAKVDQLWTAIVGEADRLYRCDGGRDIAAAKHRRSYGQRLFDAAVALFDGGADSPPGAGPTRPNVVITIDAARLLMLPPQSDERIHSTGPPGTDQPIAEQIGTGPIANEVVTNALKRAHLWTLLQCPKGRPLWLGRSRRTASHAQLIALICRDRGCVETGATWRTSEVHHQLPWNAPAAGPTDIDNLMLLSPSAHRSVHAAKMTWDYNPQTGKYFKRPATPDEIAPARADPNPRAITEAEP